MGNIATVDGHDNIIDYVDKYVVHKNGLLHRAFSVVVINENNEMLIQKRSLNKYHSAGQWSNSCCSHQYESDKNIEAAAARRLNEELGLSGLRLQEGFVLRYRHEFENNLIEDEIDHVFISQYSCSCFDFNRDEIETIKWVTKSELQQMARADRNVFTPWFILILERLAWI
jgi:isopentenyl-diphosphate delta-isomerase